MTRFVIDCEVALALAEDGFTVPAGDELLAPTLLRSQSLAVMRRAVHAGELPADAAYERLTRLWKLPIRLLGDAVLRRVAWQIAEQLEWESTYDAEYVALTKLQGDVLVTADPALARAVAGIVATTTIDALRAG